MDRTIRADGVVYEVARPRKTIAGWLWPLFALPLGVGLGVDLTVGGVPDPVHAINLLFVLLVPAVSATLSRGKETHRLAIDHHTVQFDAITLSLADVTDVEEYDGELWIRVEGGVHRFPAYSTQLEQDLAHAVRRTHANMAEAPDQEAEQTRLQRLRSRETP